MQHEFFMREALRLAQSGSGSVNPNPMVGAVIVRDGQIIGAGYHERYGGLHAERNALASCTVSPLGATLYVTLEPCCHEGKTPPCTDAILESGIREVVVGVVDPNPKVGGRGIRILEEQGIAVHTGVLEEECRSLNEVFFHYIQTGLPFAVLKYAMTADGKIATPDGSSRWVTGEAARNYVHRCRHRYAAVMTGIGTVLADDPRLTCRMEGGVQPVRIVCDSRLRIPMDSRLVRSAVKIPTWVATCCHQPQKQRQLEEAGCVVLNLPASEGRVDLHALMRHLGEQRVDSVFLEGGAELNHAAVVAGIVNRLHVYIAPKIFGGLQAKMPVGGEGVAHPDDAWLLSPPRVTPLGDDLLLEYDFAGRGA